jgi:hypothetical protein
MNDHTRRAVAYIVGRLISGRDATTVYDYKASKHFHFSGDAQKSTCNIYDYDQRCYITGTPNSLYHYGNRKHITLQVTGTSFNGYDYESAKHFSGTVNGQSISLYDYDGGQHYNYSL